jgi:hypothetical protein
MAHFDSNASFGRGGSDLDIPPPPAALRPALPAVAGYRQPKRQKPALGPILAWALIVAALYGGCYLLLK